LLLLLQQHLSLLGDCLIMLDRFVIIIVKLLDGWPQLAFEDAVGAFDHNAVLGPVITGTRCNVCLIRALTIYSD